MEMKAIGRKAADSKAVSWIRTSRKHRIILIIVIVVIALIIYKVLFTGGVAVNVQTASAGTFSDSFKENGIYSTGTSTDVILGIGGDVVSVAVQPGTQVRQGDVIAVIDGSAYANEKSTHDSLAKSYLDQADNTEKNAQYDKEDMKYSIGELNSDLRNLENTRNQSDMENVSRTSPSVYVGTLEVSMKTAENALTTTQRDAANARTLYDNGVISKNDYENAQTAYNDAQTAYSNAKSNYETAKAKLDELKTSGKSDSEIDKEYFNTFNVDNELDKTKQQIAALQDKMNNDYASSMSGSYKSLADSESQQSATLASKVDACTVKAPCDGIITALPVSSTSHLEEGAAVATIKTDNKASIECSVLTTSAPYLKVGDSVNIVQKLRGGEEKYDGHISSIYDYAEKNTSSLGLDDYRVKVQVVFDDDSVEIKDGYEFTVEFYAFPETDDVISVPNSAIFKDGDTSYVFVADCHKAVRTEVETGHKSSSRTEILSGISDGDRIIVNSNVEGLEDGVKIAEE